MGTKKRTKSKAARGIVRQKVTFTTTAEPGNVREVKVDLRKASMSDHGYVTAVVALASGVALSDIQSIRITGQ